MKETTIITTKHNTYAGEIDIEDFSTSSPNKKRINSQEVIIIEWYVYYHDSNAQKIIKWNVFNHGSFKNEVDKILQENLSRDEFADSLKKYLMYYMWSKCEYEIILSPWTGRADDIKIDVYDQIMMNFDRFVDYCWSFKSEKP